MLAFCASMNIAADNGGNSADTLSTYRNFLGETCLSLDKPAFHSIADSIADSKKRKNSAWKQNMTYAGLALFTSSIIIKNNSEPLSSARFKPASGFASSVNDYAHLSPYALIAGLKVAEYEGQSATPRLLTAAFLSNAIMAVSTEAIKQYAQSERPDATDEDSYVSGHTATAFTAATILHNEYGRTRSPWFSLGGYSVATGTAMLRILNNRHRTVDVIGGAGIGIMAAELGYYITGKIFGSKQIQRLDDTFYDASRNPSFLSVQMGAGLHRQNLNFSPASISQSRSMTDSVNLGVSTVMGIEGAYYINRYIGFGGMARITATPVQAMNIGADERNEIGRINHTLSKYAARNPLTGDTQPLPGCYTMYIEQGQMVDASIDGGIYASLPLTSRLTLGAKALIGARFNGGITYTSKNGNLMPDGKEHTDDGKVKQYYLYHDAEGKIFSASPQNNSSLFETYNPVLKNEASEFDMLRIEGSNTLNAVLGISATWRTRDCFAWRIFADYDTSKAKYKYARRLFSDDALQTISTTTLPADHPEIWQKISQTERATLSKRMNHLTIGAAFSIYL